jgi:hypothetical protein
VRRWHHMGASPGSSTIAATRFMTINPTPVTAVLTGILSATLWPLAWSRFGGAGSAFSIELVLATLLLIALPAHAFVVGFGYRHASSGQPLDIALLKRLGSWVLGGIATVGLTKLYQG